MAETAALTQRRTANPYLERLEAEVGLVDDRYGLGWSRGFRTSNFDQWQPDRTLALRDWRFRFCYQYSWAIPNAEAVAVVAGLCRIVEMGAGTGYWASLVAGAGADVVAYDQSPPTGSNPTDEDDDRTAIAAKARDAGAKWHGNERGWFPVRKGEPADLRRHRDRALLLVWPPYSDPMASDCLRYWRGETLVYVGEDSGGCTGDAEFHDRLATEFDPVREVDIPQWDGIHDSLTVYRRRHASGRRRPLP